MTARLGRGLQHSGPHARPLGDTMHRDDRLDRPVIESNTGGLEVLIDPVTARE